MLHRMLVVLGVALLWCSCCMLTGCHQQAQDLAKASRCELLEIQGMACEACAAHVQKALMQVRGVAEAKVSYAKAEAEVCIQRGFNVTGKALAKAVEKAGYKAKVKHQSRD